MEDLYQLSRAEFIREIKDFALKLKSDEISEAIDLAVDLHSRQGDRLADGPYVNHVLRVTVRAIRLGLKDIPGIIACLLHDSVEDCVKRLATNGSGTLAGINNPEREAARKILEKFGGKVLEYIGLLTFPGWAQALDEKTRHRYYRAHVEKILLASKVVSIIKLSDFIDNACTLRNIPELERQKRGARKYLPVFSSFIKEIREDMLVVNEKEETLRTLRTGRKEANKILKESNKKTRHK